MTIRVRLALWYSAALLLGLLLIAAVGYYEMAVAHPEIKVALATAGHTPIKELAEILLVGGVPVLVLAVVGGWFLMRRAMLPVLTLTRTVERVHADTLDQRLTRTGNRDELDRLTVVFNAMMGRLDESFARVREFTLHASHELKTPLTVMRVELESALRAEGLDQTQRELLANQLDEIQRLTKIVDSLAFLARSDNGQNNLNLDAVRLDDLVRDSFADAQIIAQPQKVLVTLGACEEITLKGDRHRLRQVLLNLTDNAIKYNHPGGTVAVSLRRNAAAAELKIENTGPGISPEKLPRVFDHFFRGDPSHNNGVEGCGLGLCIVQSIVNSHGGGVVIASVHNSLTTVSVRLPC